MFHLSTDNQFRGALNKLASTHLLYNKKFTLSIKWLTATQRILNADFTDNDWHVPA